MINSQVKPSIWVLNFTFTHLNLVNQGVVHNCCISPDLSYFAEKKWIAEFKPYILVIASSLLEWKRRVFPRITNCIKKTHNIVSHSKQHFFSDSGTGICCPH